MHRHGYKGRKLHGAIVTTLPKAKDLRPIVEKMVTKARKGGLSNRRALIAALNVQTANRLMDVVAPSITRDSGYLRIVKLGEYRVGDNAELARIEFVDEIKEVAKPVKTDAKASTKKADNTKKSADVKKEDK